MNRYLKSAIAGAIIFAIVSAVRGVFGAQSSQEVFMALCDGAFITGIMLICSGLLVYSSKTGFLDGISYAGHLFASRHWHRDPRPKENFYEYREGRDKKRKNKHFSDMIVIGAGFLALSAVFLLLYY